MEIYNWILKNILGDVAKLFKIVCDVLFFRTKIKNSQENGQSPSDFL